ncbi:hypothetical protein KQX64_24880 [Rhodopseudomonas palustris]|nr:hypothetical protein KQX64_24880 [Rhodopseudomonas palustris]
MSTEVDVSFEPADHPVEFSAFAGDAFFNNHCRAHTPVYPSSPPLS